MFGRKNKQPSTQEPEPSACPQEAWLELADGSRIVCVVFEDPQRDKDGLRQFWLEPVRELTGGEQAVAMGVDQLPPRSQALVRWPDGGHHIASQVTHLSWEDAKGRRYTTDSGLAIFGDVDAGFEDPPDVRQRGPRG